MALTSALVDRARRVFWAGQEDSWSQGEPPADPQHGSWFKARLQINEPAEQGGPVTERARRLDGDAELMFGVRHLDGVAMADTRGNFTAFDADDQIEVDSGELGQRVWQVNTGVEPIRKKRRVIGYRVGLRAVTEPRES